MIYDIEISETAYCDLNEIFEYISFTLASINTAKKLLDQLEEKIFSLEWMPDRHQVYDKEPWKSRGLRKMLVENFIVFYIVNSKKQLVTIIRVMHTLQDVENQLNNI